MKLIEGDLVACAFMQQNEEKKIRVQVNEIESGKKIKCIDVNNYRCMIPLPDSRLIIFSEEKQIELWDFKAMKFISQNIDFSYNSQVILLDNQYLVCDKKLTNELNNQKDKNCRIISIWVIDKQGIKLKRDIDYTLPAYANSLILRELNKTQFMIYLNGCIQVWDIDSNLIKSLEIIKGERSLRNYVVVNNFIIYEKRLIEEFYKEFSVEIRCFETGCIVKKFKNTFLRGYTDKEIFIENRNEDMFCIDIYAVDGEFSFVATLDTEHLYCGKIKQIIFDRNFSTFSFKDNFITAFKRLNTECK